MLKARARTSPDGSGTGLAQARERLQAREQALRGEISAGLLKADRESYQELAGRVSDIAERAVATLLVDVDLAEITRDVQELREVELAMQRLREGHYGVCLDCEEPIDPARLQSLPSAIRCQLCQRRFENRDRSPASRSL